MPIFASQVLNVAVPHRYVALQLRKVAGMFLYCLTQAARRITANENNHHRLRILEDEEFYKHWLYPRIQQFYHSRGWSFDDGFTAVERTSSRRAAEPSRGRSSTSVKSVLEPRRFWGRFRFQASQRIKRSLRHFRKTQQQDSGAIDTSQPEVYIIIVCMLRTLPPE